MIRQPFLGEVLERASDEQYYNGFDCLKIGCEFIWSKRRVQKSIVAFHFRGSKGSNSMGTCAAVHSRKVLGSSP